MLRHVLGAALLAAILAAVLAAPTRAADMEAPAPTADLAARAEGLLQKGDLVAARDAFAEAAKAAPDDAALAHKVALLSRVLEVEKAVTEADVPDCEWQEGVVMVHAFYLRSGLGQKALAFDRAAHAKVDSTLTASLVAETLLELGRDDEALAFVDGLREGQKDDQNRLYRDIALARLGRKNLVEQDLELYGLPVTKDPGLLYDTARLHALLGQPEPALTALKAALEGCPARSLPALRALAMASPDLASLRGTAGFEAVLATEGKTSGSCGGGCGDCPKAKEGCGQGGCDDCPGKAKEGGCGDCPKAKEGCGQGGCDGCPQAKDDGGPGGCAGGCPAAGGKPAGKPEGCGCPHGS